MAGGRRASPEPGAFENYRYRDDLYPGVDDALRHLIDRGESISVVAVAEILSSGVPPTRPTAVTIADVNLTAYDALLGEAACR